MCSVIGVAGVECSADYAVIGLKAEQHRGEESAGIACSDGSKITHRKGMGLVADVFHDINENKRLSDSLPGHIANGQTRYSTEGGSKEENAQPLMYPHEGFSYQPQLAISHNGNIPNARIIRENLEKEGFQFHTHTDTEIYFKAFESEKGCLEEKVANAFRKYSGSYSAIITTKDTLIAIKDPWGNRPISYGKINGGYVFASETCALEALNAEIERELNPGEMIVIDRDNKFNSYQAIDAKQQQLCIFEYVYFARPDSIINKVSVKSARKNSGAQLALEAPADVNFVVPVLESGHYAAEGYAKQLGLETNECIIKNRYVGRTFIAPEQMKRRSMVKIKFGFIKEELEGKKIALVEDSIVRGTTMRDFVHYLFDACKVKEVHLRIGSPPNVSPCYYGIDTPRKDELIAVKQSVEEIREFIGATTLAYLSLDGLLSSCPGPRENYCTACFNGNYQIPLNGLKAA